MNTIIRKGHKTPYKQMNVQEYANLVATNFNGREQYNVMKRTTKNLIIDYLIIESDKVYEPNVFFTNYTVEYWGNRDVAPDYTSEISEVGYDILAKIFSATYDKLN